MNTTEVMTSKSVLEQTTHFYVLDKNDIFEKDGIIYKKTSGTDAIIDGVENKNSLPDLIITDPYTLVTKLSLKQFSF